MIIYFHGEKISFICVFGISQIALRQVARLIQFGVLIFSLQSNQKFFKTNNQNVDEICEIKIYLQNQQQGQKQPHKSDRTINNTRACSEHSK
jgi:hypothetical protein